MDDEVPGEGASREAALVRRAREGDADAFDRVARRYRSALLALAFQRTGRMEDAEDLVQEVLAKAWRSLPGLQDPAAFMPWIKSIAANACNSWYRRARSQPDSLTGRDDERLPTDPGPTPFEALVAREKERELKKALTSLPDANRTALLMHVWGGCSYDEIARFAGVKLSTVEGRIYRAKQQLRRLLRDSGAGLFGEASTPPASLPTRRTKMTTQNAPEPPESPRDGGPIDPHMMAPLALVMFCQRFSTLIDSGVSLVRSLRSLEDLPDPYGGAARDLRIPIEEGHTLSSTMARMPDLFSPFLIVLVRAGEVGGVLEEALQRAARQMNREWRAVCRRPGGEEPLFMALPSSRPRPQDWADLSEYQRTVVRMGICDGFGLLLMSGVPILTAMAVMAELLPVNQREKMMEAREAIRDGGARIGPALETIGIFPRFVLEMIHVGEESGALDRVLHAAANVFEHEIECRMAPSM